MKYNSIERRKSAPPDMESEMVDKHPQTTDAQLLRHFADTGNRDAFNQFVIRHRDFSYRTALRFCRSSDDAEDAVQKAFLVIMRSADQFQGEKSARAWIGGIVNNCCRTIKRSGRVRNKYKNRLTENLQSRSSNQNLNREELKLMMREEIDSLPNKFRMPLSLRFYEAMSAEEIGEVLNLHPGTIRNTITEGVRLLRSKFAALGYVFGASELTQLATDDAATVQSIQAPESLAQILADLPQNESIGIEEASTVEPSINISTLLPLIIPVGAVLSIGMYVTTSNDQSKVSTEPTTITPQTEEPLNEEKESTSFALPKTFDFRMGPPADVSGYAKEHAIPADPLGTGTIITTPASKTGNFFLLADQAPKVPLAIICKIKEVPNPGRFSASTKEVVGGSEALIQKLFLPIRVPTNKSMVAKTFILEERAFFSVDDNTSSILRYSTPYPFTDLTMEISNVVLEEIVVRKMNNEEIASAMEASKYWMPSKDDLPLQWTFEKGMPRNFSKMAGDGKWLPPHGELPARFTSDGNNPLRFILPTPTDVDSVELNITGFVPHHVAFHDYDIDWTEGSHLPNRYVWGKVPFTTTGNINIRAVLSGNYSVCYVNGKKAFLAKTDREKGFSRLALMLHYLAIEKVQLNAVSPENLPRILKNPEESFGKLGPATNVHSKRRAFGQKIKSIPHPH